MQDHKNQKSGGINPLVMGAVGAAVGAAAVVLSDEKNRKKVMDTLNQAGEKADEMRGDAAGRFDEMRSQAEDVKGQVEDKVEELRDQADDVKGKVEKAAETAKKKTNK